MKSIRLTGTTRNCLKEYDNQSFDKIIRRLIEETREDMPRVVFDDSKTSPINISEDTYDLLMDLSISSTETVDSIVMRMLLIAGVVDREGLL